MLSAVREGLEPTSIYLIINYFLSRFFGGTRFAHAIFGLYKELLSWVKVGMIECCLKLKFWIKIHKKFRACTLNAKEARAAASASFWDHSHTQETIQAHPRSLF